MTLSEHRADLTSCDREPIHAPGSIQPHGALLVLDAAGGPVVRASANAAGWLGGGPVVGATLAQLFGPEQAADLARGLASPSLDGSPLYLRTVAAHGRAFRAVGHHHAGATFVELEPAATAGQVGFHDLYPVVRSFAAGLADAPDLDAACRLAADEVRRITGFDRVLVYRFDADWNGVVTAEARDPAVPGYLGLHFPATDIPAPARELYRTNRLRMIPDAGYAPVPILPADGPPLDLRFAALRSVSPIHCEYLRNMGVAASLSVSVLRGPDLWALIACHHRTPKALPFETRTALELLGQMLSLQVSAHEHAAEIRHRITLKGVQARLLAAMAAEGDFVRGLVNRPDDLLGFAAAGGAAVLFDGRCARVGDAPDEADVRRLADAIADVGAADLFHTDALAERFPDLAALTPVAAGVLAASVSKLHRSFVFWFRPELVRTVTWAGDPAKGVAADGRVNPRKSFEAWKQVVRGRARPWSPAEVAVAADLRNDIVGIVLRKAEERAALTAELERSNKELEAFSYSVSHDLRAPFRHIVGYAELLRDRAADALDATGRRYLDTITDSARFAGSLVDNLLSFSQMGRSALTPVRVDLNVLAAEARRQATVEARGRPVEWVIGRLPVVRGDVVMLRLVFQNLFGNAVKFTAPVPAPRVEVGCAEQPGEHVLFVRDNGAGFDMRYADKLFGVFQRLHRAEEFEGTGIGLANVRRVVQRHGGRTWAEGRVGAGATIYFTLPRGEGG